MSTIPPVKSVVILLREGPVAAAAATRLQAGFKVAGVKVETVDENGCETMTNRSRFDLVIALGGDGTFLRALRCFAGVVPVVGINCGTLGFLSIGGPEIIGEFVLKAMSGHLESEFRMRLEVDVWQAGKHTEHLFAYNDAVIKVGSNPRLLELACEINGKRLATYRADGLILSTPVGSTAYNLAAGGPILCPDSAVYVVTAICPHSLTHRPVVVNGRSKTKVMMAGPPGVSSFLTVDGQTIAELAVGDYVTVTAAAFPYESIPPEGSAFDVLAQKLGWDSKSR